MTTAMMRMAAVLAMVFVTGACSTITQGSDQSVTVDTDPSGANCKLTRKGAIVGVVNPTPGSVTVGKSKDDISVACEKDGYQKKASSLRSEFEGMTFGNIIFGGIIGVAVDASSGAMNEYPAQVTLILPPEEFPNKTARDSFFEDRRREVMAESEAAISSVEETCGDPDDKPECARAIEKIKDNRDEELADIEVERATARIAS